ncbi:thiamine biosynthesis lipoprotein ApbE [Secundilactobacillus oryzae JCM 18671]|uniref:FAD:protein FMN transferase n=1 Tax=Secundilactobacillus oryzae JCM 18671 TaxID=1291743 RepID=A0A081BHR5_9LACO|nr:FAD:protein FMN transferase [Secundilactobacillus oryzae]GAK47583.1 thiamine biosynthesis lipoprotein ApbE [Secundilactobacillus oryzae JCM 18671]
MTQATDIRHKTYYGLGTQIDLTLFGVADDQLLDEANALITRYEDALTVNRSQSELMVVNHAAGQHPVSVSPATYTLTKLAVETSLVHDGFNASIGPLVKLWSIGFKDANVPTDASIHETLKLIDPGQIELDDDQLSIFLKQPGMELDLGGISKGYIADRIRDLWRAHGIRAGIINLGGNVLLVGESPKQMTGKWRIGVQNPFTNRGDNVGVVELEACSAVTSGIYERQLKSGGQTYHHILDPETGYPRENNLASVTVFTKDSVVGEIETTRLFFAGGPMTNWPTNLNEVLGAIFITKDQQVQVVGLPEESFTLTNSEFKIQ